MYFEVPSKFNRKGQSGHSWVFFFVGSYTPNQAPSSNFTRQSMRQTEILGVKTKFQAPKLIIVWQKLLMKSPSENCSLYRLVQKKQTAERSEALKFKGFWVKSGYKSVTERSEARNFSGQLEILGANQGAKAKFYAPSKAPNQNFTRQIQNLVVTA